MVSGGLVYRSEDFVVSSRTPGGEVRFEPAIIAKFDCDELHAVAAKTRGAKMLVASAYCSGARMGLENLAKCAHIRCALVVGTLEGSAPLRHARGHRLTPTEINYRANYSQAWVSKE